MILEPPCLLNLMGFIIGESIKLQFDFVEVEFVALQVQPFSIKQLEEQPSPETLFPSSHCR